MKLIKLANGTAYNTETKQEVIDVLEKVRQNKTRIIVDYGDVKTGRSWNEIYNIQGYIGRSTGQIQIPLLVFNSRSLGGGALLDDCIVKIVTSKGKKVLYQHPNYFKTN